MGAYGTLFSWRSRYSDWLDSVEAIVLTHAHLDHSGYLPRLAHDGFHGPVYATEATVDLCQILLTDSAHIHESDADFANRH